MARDGFRLSMISTGRRCWIAGPPTGCGFLRRGPRATTRVRLCRVEKPARTIYARAISTTTACGDHHQLHQQLRALSVSRRKSGSRPGSWPRSKAAAAAIYGKWRECARWSMRRSRRGPGAALWWPRRARPGALLHRRRGRSATYRPRRAVCATMERRRLGPTARRPDSAIESSPTARATTCSYAMERH